MLHRIQSDQSDHIPHMIEIQPCGMTEYVFAFPYKVVLYFQCRIQREKYDIGIQFRSQQVSGRQKIADTVFDKIDWAAVDDIIGGCDMQMVDIGLRPVCDRLLQTSAPMKDQGHLHQFSGMNDRLIGKWRGSLHQNTPTASDLAGRDTHI